MVELAEIPERFFISGAHEFADLLALLGIEFDAALEALDGFLLELGDLGARVLGIAQTGEHFDEILHVFFDAGVEFHHIAAPLGEALFALGDVGFQVGHGFLAGLEVGRGCRVFLSIQSDGGNQRHHSSDQ